MSIASENTYILPLCMAKKVGAEDDVKGLYAV